jgi:hypothetical protein
MRSAVLAVTLVLSLFHVAASAQTKAKTLPLPRPAWYTEAIHQQVLQAGPQGVEVPLSHEDAPLVLDCLGYAPAAGAAGSGTVSAGGCMVHPSGCTMNFVFSDGMSNYIGTAGHCVDGGGDVVMQVGARVDPTETVLVTLAKIGTTVRHVNAGIGRDFGLVKIDPGFAVEPAIAGVLGPSGAFCGDPVGQPVLHYGHGYVVSVQQGVPKGGVVIPDMTLLFDFTSGQYGYNWAGYGLPGDSGSPVLGNGTVAVGNLTHGIGVAVVPVPGLSMGMTMQGIFNFIGPGYSLVTADGGTANCGGVGASRSIDPRVAR